MELSLYCLYLTKKKIFINIIYIADKIIEGGIYDQIKGGFFRYSTDNKWEIPHFEKMLYDNGLILELLSNIYSIIKDKKYQYIIDDTFEWIVNDMTGEDGSFYSSIDADSEGEEGKFYLWDYNELKI